MVNGDWNRVRVHQTHLKDIQASAERERLVSEALAGRRGVVRLYGPVLARLGAGLVTWGTGLQMRYGKAAEQMELSSPVFVVDHKLR